MWCLDAYIDGSPNVRRLPIGDDGEPIFIGRSRKASIKLPFDYVSGQHACVTFDDEGQLWVEDMGSSNGTFVNTTRLEAPMHLDVGDIIHIGATELIVSWDEHDTVCETQIIEHLAPPKADSKGRQLVQMRELLSEGRVRSVFEPVVEMRAKPRLIGFEALGRGTHEELPEAPGSLFELASYLDAEADLSVLFRRIGVRDSVDLPGQRVRLFLNTHPDELDDGRVLGDLKALRASGFELPLVVEVHETAVLDTEAMSVLKQNLSDLDIQIAYDDFGAGQARLLELIKVPPDYLKFDKSLILGLPEAPVAQVQMVRQLVAMVRDLDIACLAEGIETRAHYALCRELGFTHGQGYWLGRGQSAAYWAKKFARPLERA